MEDSAELSGWVPGFHAFHCANDSFRAGINEHYAVGRIERGRSECWGCGSVWRGAPGSIQVKEPGDVHRHLALDRPIAVTVLALPANDVARVRDDGKVVLMPHLEVGDKLAAPFRRLHDAVCAGADRLSLEVALAERHRHVRAVGQWDTEYTRPCGGRSRICGKGAPNRSRSTISPPTPRSTSSISAARTWRKSACLRTHLTRRRILRATALLAHPSSRHASGSTIRASSLTTSPARRQNDARALREHAAEAEHRDVGERGGERDRQHSGDADVARDAQRTALTRLLAHTPMMQALMPRVVATGTPRSGGDEDRARARGLHDEALQHVEADELRAPRLDDLRRRRRARPIQQTHPRRARLPLALTTEGPAPGGWGPGERGYSTSTGTVLARPPRST